MTPQSTHEAGSKALAWLVAVLGIGVLVFGAYSIRQQISSPFAPRTPTELDLSQFALLTEEDELEKLKRTDSDNDSLTDYDEIHIYNTSPYIVDSDSDGVSDAEEIRIGTDPNCLPGGNCLGIRIITPDTKISDLFPQFSDSSITLKDKTLEEFKKILVDEGFDEEKLAEIDDETLLIILEESLTIQDELAKESGTIEDVLADEDIDYNQVRLFLIDLGAAEDEVYSLSDKEIAEILQTFN